jgi:hypothetical protein
MPLQKKVLEDNNEKWGAMLHRALRIEHQGSGSWDERYFLQLIKTEGRRKPWS